MSQNQEAKTTDIAPEAEQVVEALLRTMYKNLQREYPLLKMLAGPSDFLCGMVLEYPGLGEFAHIQVTPLTGNHKGSYKVPQGYPLGSEDLHETVTGLDGVIGSIQPHVEFYLKKARASQTKQHP